MVIFLMVVVGLLLAALAQLNRGSAATLSQEVLSTRALFAAETGAQAVAMKVFPRGAAVAGCPAGAQNFSFTTTGLASCSAQVTCTTTTVGTQTRFLLDSSGSCSGGTEQGFRRIEVALRTMP